MMLSDDVLRPLRLDRERRWTTLAVLAWGILLLVLTAIFLIDPNEKTGFAPYLMGAERWVDERPIYSFKPNKGFVYSPTIAVFFSAFTLVPVFLANILWRWLSVAVLLGGLLAVFRWGPFRHIPARLRGLVFLLVLPVAAGNLHSGQANAVVVGLLLGAVAAACAGHWTWVALAVAGAFYWKIYPLALGLLLVLVAPWKLSWRLILAMGVLAFLPFAFESWDYVAGQYQQWAVTRMADNRFVYPIAIAPLDLWFVLVRVGQLPLSVTAYQILRLAAGAVLAGLVVYGLGRRWPRERVLGAIFTLSCVWMLLLGPASESLTYLILTPAAALAVVESWHGRMPLAARVAATLGYGLLVAAILRVGFFSGWQSPWLLTFQPVGALFLLGYGLMRYLDNALWSARADPKTRG